MQNFHLMFDFDQDLQQWDDMVPFERDIYLQLLHQKLEEKKRLEAQA